MSSLSLRLPESLHQKVRELAGREAISINQFIATAVAEKTATLLTVAYLEDRARLGRPRLFRALAGMPSSVRRTLSILRPPSTLASKRF